MGLPGANAQTCRQVFQGNSQATWLCFFYLSPTSLPFNFSLAEGLWGNIPNKIAEAEQLRRNLLAFKGALPTCFLLALWMVTDL